MLAQTLVNSITNSSENIIKYLPYTGSIANEIKKAQDVYTSYGLQMF